MFKFNGTDKEILVIIKKVFLAKNIKPSQSDDHFRIWLIRLLFYISILLILLRVVLSLTGKEVPDDYAMMASLHITYFFGTLFLYINSESKNSSFLIFILTCVSIVLALYVA